LWALASPDNQTGTAKYINKTFERNFIS